MPIDIKIEKFSLCQQFNKDHCIPPLISKKTIYYLSNPHVSSNMQQYIDSVFKSEKTLAFAFSFNRRLTDKEQQQWQQSLKAHYYFPTEKNNKEHSYVFQNLTFDNKNGNASVLLAELLEKKFPNAVIQDYQIPNSFSVVIELYDDWQNILIKRTVNLEIVHEKR